MSLGSLTLVEAANPADVLDTLPPWPWDILDDSAPRTLGWHAIAWGEGWRDFPNPARWDGFTGLIQPNGPRARLPFRYTSRQRRFLLWFYALDDDARWLFRYAVRRLAKGSGKSPFAAAHSLTEMNAPVRLDSFRRGAPGGCEGRPVDMPWVQIAATAESQTTNTMRMVRAFAPKKSPIVAHYDLDPGLTRYYGPPEKRLEVITSSMTAAEGAEASFVVEDEQEHWKPQNGGPELHSTVADNLAKSGNRALGTSNAWNPGLETVAEADFEGWVLEQQGRTRGKSHVLYDAVIAPPDADMSDPASLRAALERVYADCDWKKPHEPDPDRPGDLRPVPGSRPDVESIMERIWDSTARPEESRRKYFNRPTVSAAAWVEPEAWALMYDPDRELVVGEDVGLFFDGSKSGDATALLGICISDGYVFTIGVWQPEHGAEVDVVDVDLALAGAFDMFNVLAFLADVREWESFAKVSWPKAYADGLAVWAVPSGKSPQPIAWDMRSHTFEFTVEAELVQAEIDETGFTHDGDPRVAQHVANAQERANQYGKSIGKESPDSSRKIDAAVCVVGVRMVRRLVMAHLAKQLNTKKKKPGRAVGFS